MSVETRFQDVITTEDELREIMGHPSYRVTDKTIDYIDEHCRAFIAHSPFVLIASTDGAGHFDVSPKGDPPGFIQVLDNKTLGDSSQTGTILHGG